MSTGQRLIVRREEYMRPHRVDNIAPLSLECVDSIGRRVQRAGVQIDFDAIIGVRNEVPHADCETPSRIDIVLKNRPIASIDEHGWFGDPIRICRARHERQRARIECIIVHNDDCRGSRNLRIEHLGCKRAVAPINQGDESLGRLIEGLEAGVRIATLAIRGRFGVDQLTTHGFTEVGETE